jgi:hypothetical protein
MVFQIHSSMEKMIRTPWMTNEQDSGIDIHISKLCLIMNRQNTAHFLPSLLDMLTWDNPPAAYEPPKFLHHLPHLYQIHTDLQDRNIQTNLSQHYFTHSLPPWYHDICVSGHTSYLHYCELSPTLTCVTAPPSNYRNMLPGDTWHWHENVP